MPINNTAHSNKRNPCLYAIVYPMLSATDSFFMVWKRSSNSIYVLYTSTLIFKFVLHKAAQSLLLILLLIINNNSTCSSSYIIRKAYFPQSSFTCSLAKRVIGSLHSDAQIHYRVPVLKKCYSTAPCYSNFFFIYVLYNPK